MSIRQHTCTQLCEEITARQITFWHRYTRGKRRRQESAEGATCWAASLSTTILQSVGLQSRTDLAPERQPPRPRPAYRRNHRDLEPVFQPGVGVSRWNWSCHLRGKLALAECLMCARTLPRFNLLVIVNGLHLSEGSEEGTEIRLSLLGPVCGSPSQS